MVPVEGSSAGIFTDSKPAIPRPTSRRARSIPGGARTKNPRIAGRTLGQSRSQVSLAHSSEAAAANGAVVTAGSHEPQLPNAAGEGSHSAQLLERVAALPRDGEVSAAPAETASIGNPAAEENIIVLGDIITEDGLASSAHLDPYGFLSMGDSGLDFSSLDSHDMGEVHDMEQLCIGEGLLLGDMAMCMGDAAEEALHRHVELPLAAGASAGQPPPCLVPEPEPQMRVKREPVLLGLGDSQESAEREEVGKGGKALLGRRKTKVDWTPELHRRFVQAVEQLGVEKAIPSRILELMNVQCLTRHNIASHLQKYRSHRRHVTAREAEPTGWQCRPDSHPWARMARDGAAAWAGPHPAAPPSIQPRPVMGLPLMPHPAALVMQPAPHPLPLVPHSHSLAMMPLHVWGHPSADHSQGHMWQHPPMALSPAWHYLDGTMWQCPTRPVAASPPGSFAASAAATADGYLVDDAAVQLMACTGGDDLDLFDVAGFCNDMGEDLSKGILDAAISEALANPCTPLPLGLKPPSMEGVMAELQRQGIKTVPLPLKDMKSVAAVGGSGSSTCGNKGSSKSRS